MKQKLFLLRKMSIMALMLMITVSLASCEKDDLGIGSKSGKSSSGSNNGSSGSGPCSSHKLIGKWYTSSRNISVQFTGSCSGTLHYKDVNNTPGCEDGSVTKFNWETEDDILTLDYTSMTVCGEKRNPKNDPPQKYSVSGGKLTWAGATWTK